VTPGGPPRKPSDPRLDMSRQVLSERPVPETEGEQIWKQVQKIDKGLRDDFATFQGKMLGYVADIATDVTGLKERVDAVEKSTTSNVVTAQAVGQLTQLVGELSTDVRAVLRRDATQEERIGVLEKEAILRAQQAGKVSGMKWGGAATIIGPVVLWLLQHVTGIGLPPQQQAQHTPAPIVTTPLPR
jgi:hypothetical protein